MLIERIRVSLSSVNLLNKTVDKTILLNSKLTLRSAELSCSAVTLPVVVLQLNNCCTNISVGNQSIFRTKISAPITMIMQRGHYETEDYKNINHTWHHLILHRKKLIYRKY